MEQATHAIEILNKDYSNNIMMPIVHVGYNFPHQLITGNCGL